MLNPHIYNCLTIAAFFLSVLTIGYFSLWPQKPTFEVASFDPDPSLPVEIDGAQAWTYWNVHLLFLNPSIYNISLEKIKAKLFFKNILWTPAAVGTAKNVFLQRASKTKALFRLKIPLYEDASSIPNLIGECVGKGKVEVIIRLDASLRIREFLKATLSINIDEILDCGL